MAGSPVTALAPILPLLVVLASDLWVYANARANDERGTPVVMRMGTFTVDTPTAWFLACVLLWVVFFPLYLVAHNRDAGF